jgi:hypothetical protein
MVLCQTQAPAKKGAGTPVEQKITSTNLALEAWMHNPQYAFSRILQDPTIALQLYRLQDGSIQLVSAEELNGRLIPSLTQIWHFSPTDMRPKRVNYIVINPKHGSLSVRKSIEYSDFKQFDGIMSPTHLKILAGTNVLEQRTINDIHCIPLREK